jgi:hypothetical protein
MADEFTQPACTIPSDIIADYSDQFGGDLGDLVYFYEEGHLAYPSNPLKRKALYTILAVGRGVVRPAHINPSRFGNMFYMYNNNLLTPLCVFFAAR